MKTVRRCVLFVGLLLAAVTEPHAQQTTPPEEPGPEFKLIRVQSAFIDVAHPQLTQRRGVAPATGSATPQQD